MVLLAAAQMSSQADKARNVEAATRLVREAKRRGASFVGLPENFSWMGPEAERPQAAEALTGPTLSRLAELARAEKLWVLAGSILEPGAPGGRLYNTSVLLSPEGEQAATYRKIHLFDVDVGDGQPYRESAAVAPGTALALGELGFARLGLSVCYDLRFPELYRALVAKGATLLAVPAAFTLTTGKDHWEVLLRARAIENQCYVVAPAQVGRHGEKRQTYGHALICDPWGLVVARASEGEGLAVAAYDDALLTRVRRDLPCLTHRKL
jgi:predicted amidohydrolase